VADTNISFMLAFATGHRYYGSQVTNIIDIKNIVKNFGKNILKERNLLEE
jgi:hypothetical protein